MKTLPEAFRDWLDFDGAEFELAKYLGVMPDVPWHPVTHKHLFWTNNLFGNGLYAMLEALVKMGALEMNEDQQFRWNAAFDHIKAADVDADD
jgi:hypothetical protein